MCLIDLTSGVVFADLYTTITFDLAITILVIFVVANAVLLSGSITVGTITFAISFTAFI
jgi:hypothetical protein